MDPDTSARCPPGECVLSDVLAEVRSVKGDIASLRTDMEQRFATALDKASQAYQEAIDSKRLAGEQAFTFKQTQEAMVRHAETVSKASADMVKSNQEQTPIIKSTLEVVQALKKNWPIVLMACTMFGTVIGTILGAVVHAYQALGR